MKSERIFLVGFRTTGKTTIGKIIADKLNWSFLDMDFLITQEAGEDVAVLTKNGTDWRKFRKIENEILYEVSKMENIVVSCGGGVGVNDVFDETTKKTFGELNKEVLDETKEGLVILLTSSEESIKERLSRQYRNKKIMPFLNQENAKNFEKEQDEEVLINKQIEDSMETYKTRKPLYETLSSIRINTDAQSLEETANEIIKYAK
jgi:shikimate kinase